MGTSADRSLRELLADVEARSPAPGGGSASAWAGALAAALAGMAARYADQREAVERAAALRAELLEQGERELASYAPVLEALRLPADDPDRGRRIDDAIATACEAPLAIARASAELAELNASLALDGKPALAGDAIAGAVVAESCCRAATHLVEINLSNRSGDRRLAEAEQLARRAAAARRRALAA